MQYLITMPVLLAFTVIIGKKLGKVKVKEVSLGSAMIMFFGIFVSILVGLYAHTLSEGHYMYEQTYVLLGNSIVPPSIQELFIMIFLTCIGLGSSKTLIPILKKYGVRLLALAIIIVTIGFAGTVTVGKLSNQYTSYEMTGVFSGALSSTPGITAALVASRDVAENQIRDFSSLKKGEQEYITKIAGEPQEDGSFSDEQITTYQKHAETITGLGYSVTYPFGNLLVILLINILPRIFRIDVDDERTRYKIEMDSMMKESNKTNTSETEKTQNLIISTSSFFFVFLLGQIIGKIEIGTFSLTPIAGVLIVALILGSRQRFLGIDFVVNEDVLKSFQDFGLSGTLASIGLRLGYGAMTTINISHSWLIFYAVIIGITAILAGFLIGKYILKLNWMLLSGSLCGGMTNTSGLGIAIDSCKSDFPSVGYAATYPFAVVLMVIFNLIILNMRFLA